MRAFPLITFLLLSASCIVHAEQPRILTVAGELSGDRLAAWYLDKFCDTHDCHGAPVWAVGGNYTAPHHNVSVIRPYSDLTLGFSSLTAGIRHAWRLGTIRNELVAFAQDKGITHAILADCPLMNLLLARKLKKLGIHVTYIAPPEMWLWGKWGINRWLSWYCDEVIVLYPFEQEWYAKHGLKTSWYGWPLYARHAPYKAAPIKKRSIALFPGSRGSEIAQMLPLFCGVASELADKYPSFSFVWAIPSHLMSCPIAQAINKTASPDRITILTDLEASRAKLATCCVALTKPGTSTLELALLHTPMVIAFQTPWLTYQLAKWCLTMPWVGLPSIMLQRATFPELLQSACTHENIMTQMSNLIDAFVTNNELFGRYRATCKELHAVMGAGAGSTPARHWR